MKYKNIATANSLTVVYLKLLLKNTLTYYFDHIYLLNMYGGMKCVMKKENIKNMHIKIAQSKICV